MKTMIIDDLGWQLKDTGEYYTWQEAMDYALSLGDGWRLPTIKELISFYELACKNKNLRLSSYWSSSPITVPSCQAWYINPCYVGLSDKDNHYHVRCVRDVK